MKEINTGLSFPFIPCYLPSSQRLEAQRSRPKREIFKNPLSRAELLHIIKSREWELRIKYIQYLM